ncbi:MAG: oxidoreductase [Phycisphaeraceae bacterium]|nr:oxidoreductase [Phycisphaeraceae bacterium]
MPRTLARRPFRDDVELSIVGLGVITAIGMEQSDVDALVTESVEAGVNYIDTGPRYGDGEGQQKLGLALRPHRDNVFIACKTGRRDAEGALEELELSLEMLHTDHVDLYQLHGVSSREDVEQILAPGGAAEGFLTARDQGKTRYVGLSAHDEDAAIAIMDGFPCDSILFPTNFACFAQGDFGPRVIEHAASRNVARLALKALAYRTWREGEERTHPKAWYRPITSDQRELARRALYFTLSQDITAAIPPGDEQSYRMAVELAADFEPMSEADQQALLDSAADLEPIFARA